MGRQDKQPPLFVVGFDLDERVPTEHRLRAVAELSSTASTTMAGGRSITASFRFVQLKLFSLHDDVSLARFELFKALRLLLHGRPAHVHRVDRFVLTKSKVQHQRVLTHRS